MSDTALLVEGVSKFYGDFAAVDDVSFDVPKGCIYGLLGPNGAGKTTTLRMVNDILVPDRGRVELLGQYSPGPVAAKRIGYLPEERGLYPKMRVGELLSFFGELRGMDRGEAKTRASRWLARLGISDWEKKKVQDLSKGMQQKVQFATALIHEPELFILDEPWSGLDPINAGVLRDVVLEQRAAGKTVIFSTHRMEQAEQICDYVCIIARGKVALRGALDDIKKDANKETAFGVQFSNAAMRDKALSLVGSASAQGERGIRVVLDSEEPGALLRRIIDQDLAVEQFEKLEPTLHEIFVDKVGKTAGTEMAGREASS